MPITVTVEGETFSTDDLTLDEAVAIEAELGVSWLLVDPLVSALHCRAIMRTFLARTRSAEEATKIVGAIGVGTALDAVNIIADTLPYMFEDGLPVPNPGAAPATSGSPGAAADSLGPHPTS